MAYDKEAYARLRNDPEAWEKRKQRVNASRARRRDGGEFGWVEGSRRARHKIPSKKRVPISLPAAVPWATRERLMAGK